MQRLTFAAAVIFTSLYVSEPLMSQEPSGRYRLYIGTYTSGDSQGIYHCEFNAKSGNLTKPKLAAETTNPSFLAIHPSGKFLYAVNELPQGTVTSFRIDSESGGLEQLNQVSAKGAAPCHITVDATGKFALIANYSSGSAATLPIEEDGRLGEIAAFVEHEGAGPNERRQKSPHAHSINLSPDNRFAFVADLGIDKVVAYRFDAQTGSLNPAEASPSVEPGAGPRHFAFHPGGRAAYVINELHSTITAFSYDGQSGKLTAVQTISTLPAGYEGRTSTAEVLAHPSGQFVYGSNRGHDSIAVFSVDADSGKLTAAGHQGTDIKTPRNFRIDPTGRFLLAANQSSDSVIVFQIDQATGSLSPTDVKMEVGNPVCLRFVGLP